MNIRLLAAYGFFLCLFASSAMPTASARPQNKEEMCATLLLGMRRSAEAHGAADYEPSAQDIAWAARTVDRYVDQLEHPLRTKYGSGLDAMPQEKISELFSEVQGTRWAAITLSDQPFQDVSLYLGAGEWFSPVAHRISASNHSLSGLIGALASVLALACAASMRRGKPRHTGRVGGALDYFARLCSDAETREIVYASAADLRRDVREMSEEARSRWSLLFVRFWRSSTTIIRVTWDAFARAVRSVASVVRDIMPTRMG